MSNTAKTILFAAMMTSGWSLGNTTASAQSDLDSAPNATEQAETDPSFGSAPGQPGEAPPTEDNTWGEAETASDPQTPDSTQTTEGAEFGDSAASGDGMALPDNSGSAPPEQPKVRVRAGLRLGYSLPAGEIVDGRNLSTVAASSIPLILEVSAAHFSGWELGLLLRLAVTSAASEFEQSCSDCSVFGGRLAIQLDKHANPGGVFDPWVGLTLGIETLRTSREGTLSGYRYTSSTSYTALPDLGVQAGAEFGSEDIRIGPYVSLSMGYYSDVSSEFECQDLFCPFGSESVTNDISNSAWHAWLSLGVRGSYIL